MRMILMTGTIKIPIGMETSPWIMALPCGIKAALFSTHHNKTHMRKTEDNCMDFFNNAVNVLQTVVIALGAGLGIWGGVNLMEGYGNDNPGAKSQGMKQLMAGGGVALMGTVLVPLLSGLFSA